METAGFCGQEDVMIESSVVDLATENREKEPETPQPEAKAETDSSREEEDGENILKRLSPLLYSMRLFGLYFTGKQRVNPAAAPELIDQRTSRCPDWNFERIYSTIMLAITWLNAIRIYMIFNGKETLGAALFTKLAITASGLMNLVLHSSYYYASNSGSLNRVLRDASSHMANKISKYDRLTKVLTFLSWISVAWNMFQYVYDTLTDGDIKDFTYLSNFMPETHMYVVKAVFYILHLHTICVLFFPLTMKLINTDSFVPNVLRYLPGLFSSSNELHGDDIPVRPVQQLERRVQQMCRRHRRV